MNAQRILLINVPHTAIGSRIPDDHLPPLGLLCIGGPLIDAGHTVKLIDADRIQQSLQSTLNEVDSFRPDIVMFGHTGSSTAHLTVIEWAKSIKQKYNCTIIYGGIHPSYFWRESLMNYDCFDYIVRGEGEKTVCDLVTVLAENGEVSNIAGIAYKDQNHQAIATKDAVMIENLDDYRVGWELINFDDYSYWGGYKAVVIQFSRGCPHLCSYCGQRGYWSRWRHHDPVFFAKEIARLHKEHGVVLFNFADENFSTSKRVWQAFLEAIIAENIDVRLVASMRADDIVRDADILHLYKKAGFERFLLGIEHTDVETLAKIKKGGSAKIDQQAILLLRQHGILSLATWVVGFNQETDKTLWQGFKQLLMYDPDQIQMLYSTPHRWTEFGQSVADHKIIQPNLRLWDYKHQVLAIPNLAPWRLFSWVKSIEIMMQIRPKALKRLLFHPESKIRQGMRWYYKIGRCVWFYEVFHFLFKDKRVKPTQSLQEYWGNQHFAVEEDVLQRIRVEKKTIENTYINEN